MKRPPASRPGLLASQDRAGTMWRHGGTYQCDWYQYGSTSDWYYHAASRQHMAPAMGTGTEMLANDGQVMINGTSKQSSVAARGWAGGGGWGGVNFRCILR